MPDNPANADCRAPCPASATISPPERFSRPLVRQFGSRGYDAVSLEDIGAEARVTTGAIYHHFKGKKALFQGVAEAVEADLHCSRRCFSPFWRRCRGQSASSQS
jgi:hypothetical protein